MPNLATTVRKTRARLGLTQAALAEELGVNVQTIQRWEQGRNEPSRLAQLALEQLVKQMKQGD